MRLKVLIIALFYISLITLKAEEFPATYQINPDSLLPYVEIEGNVAGRAVSLSATGTSPGGLILTYLWSQDESNPEQLDFSAITDSETTVTVPDTEGEYYVNVKVTDTGGRSFTARRIITANSSGVTYQTSEYDAAWINDLNLYEINAYAWSWGGVFNNVEAHLDSLVELGINTIWFTPLFEGEGMGYHTTNYYQIEEALGTNEELGNFVQEAHEKGIKIILDLVVNHTSKNHPFFQSCLDDKGDSPYADYYMWEGIPGESNFDYLYNWDNLPNLNVANPEVEEYLTGVAEYWVANYDVDGYRADVAWGVEQRSGTFWKKLAERVKNIKPEVYLLAEGPAYPKPGSYEDTPSPDHNKTILFDDRFTSAYDWNLRAWNETDGLPGILNGNISIDELHNIIAEEYPENALPLRFIENHDVKRAVELFGAERSKLAHTLIFTIPGVPLLYSGAETGQEEQFSGLSEDPLNLQPYFRKVINARKNYIKNNSALVRLSNTNESTIYSYATISSDSNVVVSVLNFSSSSSNFSLALSALAEYQQAPLSLVSLLDDDIIRVETDGINSVPLSLAAYEAKLFILRDGSFVPLQADFTANTTSGELPFTVQFSDNSNGNVTGWEWSFGDGQTSSEQNPLHTYESLGTFTVSLIITGPDGLSSDTKEGFITVTEMPSDNLITNGAFAAGMQGWSTFVNSNAQAEASVNNGTFQMIITSGGDAGWNIQLIQGDIPIEEGTAYTVTLNASASASRSISVDLSEDGGSYTQYGSSQFNLTQNMQDYSFTFTMNNSTDEYARFVINMGNSSHNVFIDDISVKEYVAQPAINLVSPNGGEVWKAGSSQSIVWQKESTDNVIIEFSKDNGQDWEIISPAPQAGTSFNWIVSQLSAPQCLVRVSSVSVPQVNSTSQNPFSIINPTLTLTSPAGGEVWEQESSQEISWNSNDVDNVNIYFSNDNGSNWTQVAMGLTASGSNFTWVVPTILSSECVVKLVSAEDESVSAESLPFTINQLVSVEAEVVPTEYAINQNYPNPFNPVTTFEYSVPEAAHVSLAVYGVQGSKVATLVDGKKVTGYYKINFDAAIYPSGVYFAVMESGSFRQVIKMVLMK